MKRHLRWLVPAVCVLLLILVVPLALVDLVDRARVSAGAAFGVLCAYVLLIAAVVVGAVLAVRGGMRTHREWRRRNGHLTVVELAALEAEGERVRAWQWAGSLRDQLARTGQPPLAQVWDLVPLPGEVFQLDVHVDYERYYGQDVTWTQTSGFYLGSPAFVLLGLAADGIGNANRQRAAERAAAAQWRERQWARVVVSNVAVHCYAGGRWLRFDHAAVRALYPEPRSWAVVCDFGEAAAPLRLRGLAAPAVAVLILNAIHGRDAVAGHPAMRTFDPVQP